MVTIGILGLQGGVSEHAQALQKCGAGLRIVKTPADMTALDGLILPGGESTTITKLVRLAGLEEPLNSVIQRGLPVWGTCAGAILLSTGGIFAYLEAEIARNAFGPQLHSMISQGQFMDRRIPMVFIRAPRILGVEINTAIIGRLGEDIVAVRKGHVMATTFHPELCEDTAVTRYFLSMARPVAALSA
jgi:pyridoxal 5'-phosphate synthase pdxT subunit